MVYLAPRILDLAESLFQKAQAAVRSNSAELARVQEAELGIRYVKLMRTMPTAKFTAIQRTAFLDRVDRFARDMRRFGIKYISENRPVSGWITTMQNSAR